MTELPRHALPPHARSRGVTAVLGPTNTGKTHYAIERMLAHKSGIIGLPLRLLAREVYQRAVDKVGVNAVALITGEEKIKPEGARYWVCTVEAMPLDLDVEFVAIDEVQLASNLERGHVFTDRILHRRGRHETLLLGAGTMSGIVRQLLPGAQITDRPRLSNIAYAGAKKITRLPPRSAVVAFSTDEVYAIAELIRRQRGGAAVVLGALSPRTRNAQVALYQSGDVDFLVATDAIGMGLNLDVDHVAFASKRKFDGFQFRDLTPAEMAQIAGRAGRHVKDGTFGVTGRVDDLETELVQRLEGHDFEPVRVLQWRNPALDFTSLDGLRASLALPPKEPGLTRAPSGEDAEVIEIAAADRGLRELATGRATVERLWEAAQVPDYRKVSPASHAELCLDIFRWLATRGTIPDDWYARHVVQSERVDGDIDTLSTRIAHMRTWTFVANRPDWLDDPEHWRETTRRMEDRLSDALHERLTQRFVDRRTSVLMRRLRENAVMEANIDEAGDVSIEGQPIGRLEGFVFTPLATAEAEHGKALRAAAVKTLTGAIANRAEKVAEAGNDAFLLDATGTIRWTGMPIARLVAGEDELSPGMRLLADDLLSQQHRDWVDGRVGAWLRQHVGTTLKPLLDLKTGTGAEGIARGIAYQVGENLGVIERSRVANDIKSLDQAGRGALRTLGVRFGAYHLFVPAIMKPKPRALAAQLWALKHGGLDQEALRDLPALAQAGRTSIPVDKALPKALYRVLGYRVLGERAVRVDILERLADIIRPLIAYRPGITPGAPPKGTADGDGFVATVEMTSLVGCSGEDFAGILKGLGYRVETKPAADLAAVLDAAREKAAQEVEAQAAARAAEAAAKAVAEAAAREAARADAPEAETEARTEGEASTEIVSETAPSSEASAEAAPDAVEAVVDAPATMAPAAQEEPAPEPGADPVTEAAPEPAATDIGATAMDTPAEAIPAEPIVPMTVEIWRPARFERRDQPRAGERRDDRRPRGPRPEGQAAEGPPPTEGGRRPDRPGRDRNEFRRDRPPRRDGEAPRPDTQAATPGEGEVTSRGPRPDRPKRQMFTPGERPKGDRPDRPPRPEGDRPRGPRPDRDRRDGGGAPRVFSSEDGAKKGGPDPDSPFAKLLALKQRMEGGGGGQS